MPSFITKPASKTLPCEFKESRIRLGYKYADRQHSALFTYKEISTLDFSMQNSPSYESSYEISPNLTDTVVNRSSFKNFDELPGV